MKRTLAQQKFRLDLVGGDPLYVRDRGEADYRAFGAEDADALRESFRRYRRERFWDL